MEIVNALLSELVNPAIYLLSAAAFVYFLYGVVIFIINKNQAKNDGVEKGKKHMLWGLIGLLIIYSANSIYTFIISFFN